MLFLLVLATMWLVSMNGGRWWMIFVVAIGFTVLEWITAGLPMSDMTQQIIWMRNLIGCALVHGITRGVEALFLRRRT